MTTQETAQLAGNYIGGDWRRSQSTNFVDVTNPATSEILASLAMAEADDVHAAVSAASAAFPEWRRTPAQERIQYLFKFRNLLYEHADEIARITTMENGKTLTESAQKFKVNSTPTFFINGKMFRGALTPEELDKQVAPYLKG